MKKICVIFCVIIIFSLCSCRKINQTDNSNLTSNNSSSVISSDFSSTVSEITLPEREEPNTSSNTSSETTSTEQTITKYDDTTDLTTEEVSIDTLTLETATNSYVCTSPSISLVLYNERKTNFKYYTDFFLQKYNDGKWEYVETKNGIIDYKFNVVTAITNVEFINLNLQNLYELPLEIGTYRIIQQSDEGTMISNEFTITEEIIDTEIEMH